MSAPVVKPEPNWGPWSISTPPCSLLPSCFLSPLVSMHFSNNRPYLALSACWVVLTLHTCLLHLFPLWCLVTPSARAFWTIVRKEGLLPFIPCQSWGAVAMAEHLRVGGCVEECCIWAYTSGTGRHLLFGFQWGLHASSTHREKWEEKQETKMISIPTFWQPALKGINLTLWKLNPPFRKDIEF